MARARRWDLEQLEARTVPATFGIPWHDGNHLTLSLAPDGTAIASHQSTLFQTLDNQIGAGLWQRDLLRAFQTWAVQANVNIGVVADGGQPFGVSGPEQHDPRFGDIRVGAQSMSPEVLSISVPPGPNLSGTLSGDVFLNSTAAIDSTNLFPILLHEAGHVFGLDDSPDPNSPLYGHFNGITTLTAEDIQRIQSLYGARAADLVGNDTFDRAAQITFPRDGYNGSTPIVAYGDISSAGDGDYFWVRPPDGYEGPATLRLQSAGISLLEPRLTVYDAGHHVLGGAVSTQASGDVLTVHLDQVNAKGRYFLKVESAAPDVMGIGRYGIAVTFDTLSTIPPEVIDMVLRGPYETLHSDDIDRIFEDPSGTFFNDDQLADNTSLTATALKTTAGYAPNTHYEALASLTDAADVDYFRIKAANAQPGEANILSVTLRALEVNGVDAKVSVFDNNLNPVAADVLVNGNDTYTIQVRDAKAGANYFLQVVAAQPAGNNVGNYSLVVNFGRVATALQTFASGTLDDGHPQDGNTLYIAQSQLFHFNLSADAAGSPADAVVHMVIDDASGNPVFALDASEGDTVSGSVFLTPGAYSVRITANASSGQRIAGLAYRIRGTDLTDPIGTALDDPTTQPLYLCADDPTVFCYPGDIASPDPFLWVAQF